MAGTTGLEPATSAVTGQRSNQLSYVPRLLCSNMDIEAATDTDYAVSVLCSVQAFTLQRQDRVYQIG
jgi:hypothetical protein